MKHKFKISIGDWSQDGHNLFNEFAFQSNYSVKELQDAYKNSCKLVGLQFHSDEDFTGKYLNKAPDGWNWNQLLEYNNSLSLFAEYQDRSMPESAAVTLLSFDLPVIENFEDGYSPEELTDLILHFIKLSLPKLKWKEIGMTSKMKGTNFPCLNGWWCKMNVGFGYGLYD